MLKIKKYRPADFGRLRRMDHKVERSRPTWSTWWNPISTKKIQKISWAWWHVPVIPATQDAEAGELPKPRRRRLRWAEIAPLHSSLGNKSETASQSNKNQERIKLVQASSFLSWHLWYFLLDWLYLWQHLLMSYALDFSYHLPGSHYDSLPAAFPQ